MSDKKPKFNREAFKKAIAFVESSGGKNLDNPGSSAAGRYHFLYRYIKNDPDLKGVTKREFMNNPELQEKIMDKAIDGTLEGYPSYEKKAYDLKGRYDTNLRVEEIAALTHFLGGTGVEKYMQNGGHYDVPGKNASTQEYISRFNEGLGTVPGYQEKPLMKSKTTIDNSGGLFSEEALGQQLPDGTYNAGEPVVPVEQIYANEYYIGGPINTQGEGLVEFNSGGTHEENPLGGIPQGVGSNGLLNTVEEGESKFTFDDGDYVFSNRIAL